ANKIRHAGDKSKIISGNDKSGFTFRGRFTTPNEAASISYEVSQKAHNALKWLIQRQGEIIDNRVFLIWSSQEVETYHALGDGLSFQEEFFNEVPEDFQEITYTAD